MNEQTMPEVQAELSEEELTAAAEELAAEETSEEEELRAALLEANIRLALLLAGAAKEKLDEAAKLVEGLCTAGSSPADAAAEIMGGYPHLRAVQRELPQFAAQTGGSDDGFALIRSIFSRR